MAEVFRHVHASDLTEWSSTAVDSGDLSWASGAGLGGTTGGMSFVIDDTNAIYAQKDGMTNAATDYRYAFYIKNVSLSLGASDAFELVWLHTAGTRRHFLEIFNNSGTISLRATLRNDASSPTTGSVALGATGSTGAFYEVHVKKASSNVASDATCYVYKDGNYASPVISITGVDLYDAFDSMTQFRIGANTGLDAGTSGTFYIDEVTYRNDATQIGPNNTAATITVPGAKRYVIGVAEVVSGLSVTDPDSGDVTVTCTSNNSKGTWTAPTPTNVDVSGSGTGTMTLTGTPTELNTYFSSGNGPAYTHSTANHDADVLGFEVDDGVATPDSDTVAVTAVDWRITASTMEDLNATFQNLLVTEATAQDVLLSLYAVDSGGRSGTAQTTITVQTPSSEVASGLSGAAGIDVGIHV